MMQVTNGEGGAAPSAQRLPWLISAIAVCVALGSLGMAFTRCRGTADSESATGKASVDQPVSGTDLRNDQERTVRAIPALADSDPFEELNENFHANYRRVKENALKKAAVIVVVEQDDLVLLMHGERMSERFTPGIYHTLKAVAHLPLGLYATLSDLAGSRLDDGAVEDLTRTGREIGAVKADIERGGMARGQVERQLKICEASERLLEEVTGSRIANPDRVLEYVQEMAPLMMANAGAAAASQLDGLHAVVTKWRTEHRDVAWNEMYVVVMGVPPARRDNLAVQYFSRLLKRNGEGPRLFYSESVFDEARALELLSTRIVDDRASAAFFGDAEVMQRDILAEAARRHIEILLPQ